MHISVCGSEKDSNTTLKRGTTLNGPCTSTEWYIRHLLGDTEHDNVVEKCKEEAGVF